MITVDKIRNDYPNPVQASDDTRYGEYCVGGAFCLFVGKMDRFPLATTLATLLTQVNPALNNYGGLIGGLISECEHLTSDNDAGKFEAAWDRLDRLLKFKRRVKIT